MCYVTDRGFPPGLSIGPTGTVWAVPLSSLSQSRRAGSSPSVTDRRCDWLSRCPGNRPLVRSYAQKSGHCALSPKTALPCRNSPLVLVLVVV
ncbi:unnamed protein product [Merluccius merluccius]